MPYQPIDPTLTDRPPYDLAKAYMNGQFRNCGMQRDLNVVEIAKAATLIKDRFGWQEGDPVTGTMANYVGPQMQNYVDTLIKARPFVNAPECDSCPSPYSYNSNLPAQPPDDDTYLRQDGWGMEIGGLPWAPRLSSEHPERCLTYMLYKWDAGWRQRIYQVNAGHGHNRLLLSLPDAVFDGGYSLPQFHDLCAEVSESCGVSVMLGAKSRDRGNDIDCDPPDQTLQQWQDTLGPRLEAIRGVAKEGSIWEYDLFNTPGDTAIAVWKWLGDQLHAQGMQCYAHFSTNRWAWQADGQEGDAFWVPLGDSVDGLNMQTSPTDDIGDVQSRLVDILAHMQRLGRVVRAWEVRAAQQFSGPLSEQDARIFGFLVQCTQAPMRLSGYGNGGWNPYMQRNL